MSTRYFLNTVGLVIVFVISLVILAPAQSRDWWEINTVAGNGSSGFSGDGGAANSAQLNAPVGVAVDNAGNLYIGDTQNHRIRKVTPDGVIVTIAGNGTSGFGGDGGPATAAQLFSPEGISLDSSGNLYIADRDNGRIRKVTPDGVISTFAGSSERIDWRNIKDNGDGGLAVAAKLFSPRDVVLDGNGMVYIADGVGQVRKVSPLGIITTAAGAQTEPSPQPPCFNLEGIPATSAWFGSPSFTSPSSIDIDEAGNLYVASYEDRVSRISLDGLIRTVAGHPDVAVVIPECLGFEPTPAMLTRLYQPEGVALDSEQNLYITEVSGNDAWRVTPQGQIAILAGLHDLYGHGSTNGGYSGDGGEANWARLQGPSGVAVDHLGNVYIADTLNHRIRKISKATGPAPLLTSWILPSSAMIGGLADSYWTTDLTVANTGAEDAPFVLKFLRHDWDGSTGLERPYFAPAGASVTLKNVLASFYAGGDYGAIRLLSPSSSLVLVGQTSTPWLGGTFGQSVPAVAAGDWITPGREASIPGIREDSQFRTNLVLANASEAEVESNVSLISEAGLVLASRRYVLPPLGMTQITKVVREFGIDGEVSSARLHLSTPTAGGAFTAYAVAIDNVTNDPRTLLPVISSSSGVVSTWFLPSSARVHGVGGSFYTTDLTIANTGSVDASFSLKFLGNNQDGTSGAEKSLLLSAGKSVTYPDVLSSVFGIQEGFGAIRITSSGSLAILGQTSTPAASGGTFGQSVPATSFENLIVNGVPRNIIGVSEDTHFRTNLILSNAMESPAQVDITLVAESGQTIGNIQVELPPLGMTQLDRIVRQFAVTDEVSGTRLLLSTATPGGAFASYASVIDNITNDPRTLLPR